MIVGLLTGLAVALLYSFYAAGLLGKGPPH